MRRLKNSSKKIFIGVSGALVVLLGIIMIPYPGPGWLVVFLGLSILATEFDWAKSVHDYAHEKYDAWLHWLSRQPLVVRALFWLLTAIVVVLTVWLLNGYGMIGTLLHWNVDWLRSPLMRGQQL